MRELGCDAPGSDPAEIPSRTQVGVEIPVQTYRHRLHTLLASSVDHDPVHQPEPRLLPADGIEIQLETVREIPRRRALLQRFTDELAQGSAGAVLKPSAVADVIAGSTDPLERSLGFDALAEAFAAICIPATKDDDDVEVTTAVSSVA